MFCHHCGSEIEEGAVFCSSCGAALQEPGRNAAQAETAAAGRQQAVPNTLRKGKGGLIAIALAVLALAGGTAGSIFYFTSDGYICRKDMKLAEACLSEKRYEEAIVYCSAALERDAALTDAYLEKEPVPQLGYAQSDSRTEEFDDWEGPLLIYQRFLREEETLRMREDAWCFWDRHENWTLQDILTEIEENYLERSDHGVTQVEYAFMDCGEDGVEEMQIRFVGMDIYSPGDDSDLTMVITNRDGQLEMVYSCESWARSVTEIDYYGVITGGGSNGAGDHVFEMGYIDGNGDVQSVYEGEELAGWWISYLSGAAYAAVFADFDEHSPEMVVDCYTIGGEKYYTWYADEALPEYQQYADLCEQEGRRFVTEEEIEILIDRRRTELGIRESWETGKELDWNSWDFWIEM